MSINISLEAGCPYVISDGVRLKVEKEEKSPIILKFPGNSEAIGSIIIQSFLVGGGAVREVDLQNKTSTDFVVLPNRAVLSVLFIGISYFDLK